MTTARAAHGCALVKNAATGINEILAIGGFTATNATDSIEAFNIPVETWRTATGRVQLS